MATQSVIDHVACAYQSRENAYTFLGTCFGLDVLREFTLEERAARRLLGLDRPVDVLVFGTGVRLVEAFIAPEVTMSPGPNHICLLVPDLPAVLKRCEDHGHDVRAAWVRDHEVYFVQDMDGNLFELKQAS